ncbi:GPR1/FUN34/YaaH family transporter [Arthrobacter sp. NyZ413]|uniref:GPR1/FUN34/YaaH family transporter n=1 Tax=Arthrobacter sp. NyZ413 TaxID=3144669 RepID=UPI003BF79264
MPNTSVIDDLSFAVTSQELETPSGPLAGTPGIVGIPMAVTGAFGLGLVNTGFVPASAAAVALPTAVAASAVGLLLATVWACALGQNASAGVFALFFGFFASYSALSLGLINGWYGITAEQAVNAQSLWLICWLFAFALLTLVTLRLPWTTTLMLVFVDAALVLLLIGTVDNNASMINLGGWFTFAFVAVAVYLYVDVMWSQTGGRGLPLGKPLVR